MGHGARLHSGGTHTVYEAEIIPSSACCRARRSHALLATNVIALGALLNVRNARQKADSDAEQTASQAFDDDIAKADERNHQQRSLPSS